MTTVGQAATAEIVTGAAAAPGWLARAIGLGAVALALLSALATFLVLADLTPIPETNEVVIALLLANAITIALLVAVSAWEVWRIVQARRRGRAASRLHVRIVGLFSVIAAVPAILVAVVASVTLDRGLDKLFSRQTQSLIQNSLIVSDAYVHEHAQSLGADCITTAIEVAWSKTLFDQNREQFRQFLTRQSNIRGLAAMVMIDSDLNVIEQAGYPGSTRPSTSLRARCSPPSTRPIRRSVLSRCQLRGGDHQAAELQQYLSLRRAGPRPASGSAVGGPRRPASPNMPSSKRSG